MLFSKNEINPQEELKSEILLNKSKMIYQIKEIEWTKTMIKKCQNCVNQHKDILNDYVAERANLKEERSYLNLLEFDDDNFDNDCSDTEESVIPVKTEEVSDFDKLILFGENYEIIKLEKSPQFYRSIGDRLDQNPQNNGELFFPNQTLIPNELKVCTAARKMILFRIQSIGEYSLNEIISQPVTMAIDLHISTGCGELLSIRGEEPNTQYNITAVRSPMSYFILKSQTTATRFILLVTTVPLTLAIDVHDPLKNTRNTTMDLPIPSGFTFVPPIDTIKCHYSFIKRDLQLKEIRSRLLFVAASFAEDVQHCLVPLALTVIDYQGKVLINTVMCPRARINNYCQSRHGLGENEVIGRPDMEETLSDLYNLIWDRIIVGFDLSDTIKALKIDMNYVCGVRDLQSCYALKTLMKSRTETWQLSDISEQILRQRFQTPFQSADKVADVIRQIYIGIESHWQDSMSGREMTKEGPSAGYPSVGYPTVGYPSAGRPEDVFFGPR